MRAGRRQHGGSREETTSWEQGGDNIVRAGRRKHGGSREETTSWEQGGDNIVRAGRQHRERREETTSWEEGGDNIVRAGRRKHGGSREETGGQGSVSWDRVGNNVSERYTAPKVIIITINGWQRTQLIGSRREGKKRTTQTGLRKEQFGGLDWQSRAKDRMGWRR